MAEALAVVPIVPSDALALTGLVGDVLENWLTGKNAHTVAAYRRDLESFRAFVAPGTLDGFLALEAGPAHAVAHRYRGWLMEHGFAPATINRKLAALRSVADFAQQTGRTAWTLKVKGVPSAKYRDTRGPGVEGVRAMLAHLEGRDEPKALRDYAILRLLFDLALRRAEVVSLDVAHVDLVAGKLSVLGKKRLEREALTLNARTRAAVAAWLAVRGDAPGALFLNLAPTGARGRLTGRSVARIVGALGSKAGLGVVRPHGLRHAGVTFALDVSTLREAQRFSRHADPRTLMIYDDNRADVFGKVSALVAEAV